MTTTQAELRERFSKQHEKWLIGTCDDAEAAQEWVMENLPSLLALLPPAPAVGEAIDSEPGSFGLGCDSLQRCEVWTTIESRFDSCVPSLRPN